MQPRPHSAACQSRKTRRPRTSRAISTQTRAMALIEVLCVLAVLFILVVLTLPYLARPKVYSARIKCINNLKNVGLAYRIWATDNNGNFPFQVSTNQGGSLELRQDLAAQFRILSNELSTPKIILCPRPRSQAREATNWSTLHATNIGYYIGLNASQTNPASILSGDTGFTINNAPPKSGLNPIRPSDLLTYPKKLHIDGDLANLLLADGSVRPHKNKDWPQRLTATGSPTNLFLLP